MAQIVQNHYVLAVHDLKQCASFFEQLGFRIVQRPPGWIFVQRDHCMIMLGDCKDSLPAADLGDHSYFAYLMVDNADEYHRELQSNGIKAAPPVTKPWGMREFGVKTPEGHRIQIGARVV